MNRLINLSLLLLLLSFISVSSYAQDDSTMLTIKGFRLTIKENSSLFVNGNVNVLENSDGDDNIHNEGILIITDTLFNNVDLLFLTSTNPSEVNEEDEKADPMGTVFFKSNKNKFISGDSSIYFYNLKVSDSLFLNTSIKVLGEIELNKGNLYLNGNNIDLFDLHSSINKYSGKLKQGTETSQYRIFDDSTGLIRDFGNYDFDSYGDSANIGFFIKPSSKIGKIFITRTHWSDTSVSDGGIKKAFIIENNENNDAEWGINIDSLQFHYNESDLFGDLVENDFSLRMFYKAPAPALDSNIYKYLGGEFDSANESIRVNGVNFHKGYYTIADSICDNPPRVNLGQDQIICEGNKIELWADTIYSDTVYLYGQKQYMTYKWWSPDFIIENPDDLKKYHQIISNDTVNNYLEDTLTIRLMVTDERGCINWDTIQLYTFENPKLGIKISSPNSNICMGDTVTFLDTITKTGNYQWTFKNGQDNMANPQYVFNDHDNYNDVTVEFTDENGCKDNSELQLLVHPLPEPSFVVADESCLGQELVLTNETNINEGSISKYTWGMGNGNQIKVTPDAIISNSTTLKYYTDTITDIGGIPGPDLSYYYNQTGVYDINLTAESFVGCVYDTTITTHVYDSVHAAFDTTSYTNVCFGLESRFFPKAETSDTNLVTEYQWHFNDTIIVTNFLDDTVNYKFNKAGIFDVSFVAVSKYGCTDTVTQKVKIYHSPVAVFTVDPVCLNSESRFISSGSIGSDNYTWYFEDTTIYSSSTDAVKYTFSKVGNHFVELEISNDFGCKAYYSDSAIVLKNPEANFIVRNACINNQVGDTLIINTSNNIIETTYSWEFGDLSNFYVEQPLKIYKDAGKFHVSLKSTAKYSNDLTCSTTYKDSVEIFDIAPADFKVGENTNVCEGNTSEFMLADFTNAGEVDYYEWQFETDTIKSVTDTVYQFSANGTYNVTLKTVTNNGCIDDTTKSVVIYETPIASIISDSVCLGEELVFSVSENISELNVEYDWYFNKEHLEGSRYAYINSLSIDTGTYELVLQATSENGCVSYDTSSATVHPLPSNLFKSNKISVCSDTLQLSGENSDYNYLWNNSISGNVYTVRYNEICTVEITNKLTGCQLTESVEVTLSSPLNVELGNDTSVCGSFKLDAGYFGENATYNWSNEETGRYINVSSDGEYKVTVNQGGCSVSDSIQVIINNIPILDLGADIEVCAFETVNLNAEIATGESYLWSNGLTSGNIEITSNIAQSNNYKVTVTDDNNCSTSDQVKVTFNPVPNIDLGDDIEVCQNNGIALNATIANAKSYQWNTGEINPVIYPEEFGDEIINKTYSVRVENNYGCESRDTVSVQFNPISEVILQDEIVACGNEEITLSAYIPGAISYTWNNGSVDSVLIVNQSTDSEGVYYVRVENQYNCISTSNQSNVLFKSIPVPVLPDQITGCNEISLNAGNFGAEFLWNDNYTTQNRKIYQSGLYTVEITNGNNCSIIDSVETIVNYVTKPYLGPDISMCTNDQKVLRTGIHDPAYTFEWNGYSTGDTMLIATSGTYTVRATHSNGCEDSDTIEVIGRPLPSVNLGPDMYKCTDDYIILDAGKDGFAYYWGSSNGIVASERLFEVSDTGKYWVQVTNDYSCVQSDTITIKPTSLSIDPMFVTNSKLVAGDSVLFVDMSQPEPLSWLWEFGDLQQSVLQNPVHVYYSGKSYQVILHVSNSVCNASIVKIIEVEHRNKSGNENEEEPGLFGDNFIEIQSVKIYPNPNNGNFTIEAEFSTRTNANVYIFDLMGRLISVRKYNNVEILNQYVDIQSKSSGIYIIKIIAGTDHKTYKIIKQ